MTRQVTASAAMTLAVLMSSLDKKMIQHNQTQWSQLNHIIIHFKCYIRAVMIEALKMFYVLFNSLHSINGKGSTMKTSISTDNTAVRDWHYSLLYLTSSSSSSDDDASSEESPQSHESVSQESIFRCVSTHRVPLQSALILNSTVPRSALQQKTRL